MTPSPTAVVRFRAIGRSFGTVAALRGVDLEVHAGEVHAIVGENGAGKSTLLRLLAGAESPDTGSVEIDGRAVAFDSPLDARYAGIEMVHQETSLVPGLTVAENVVLGREPHVGRTPFLDRGAARAAARDALARLGAEIDPDLPVTRLSIAARQMVEIAKALFRRSRVLALDEPTAALSEREAARLFDRLRALRSSGAAILYVSHRLEEVFAIADRITVLRDGERVATIDAGSGERTRADLVRWMAGRDVLDAAPARSSAATGAELLRAERVASASGARGVSLSLRAGEIVGLAGLVGSGRTAVLRALYGADPLVAGSVLVNGRPVLFRGPRDALRLGIGFVAEDRKRDGLLLSRSVRENVTLASLRRFAARGVLVRRGEEAAAAASAASSVDLRAPSLEIAAGALSGGNQQKALLARALLAGSRILLLDEPTRGIDVAAKAEIHAVLRRFAADGAAILVVSSDGPELLALAERLYVLRDGRVEGELARDAATPERILDLATGGAEALPSR